MKILYVASTKSHLDSFHKPYIAALEEMGHSVLTMARGEGCDFNIPFEKKILSRENSRLRGKIKEIVLRENFDLIILNTSLAAYHVRRALNKKRRPRVLNIVHGYLFSFKNVGLKAKIKARLLLMAERLTASVTDAILLMNEEDLKIAVDFRLTAGEIDFCSGMGIPDKSEMKALSEIPDAPHSILFVGELSGRKNQRMLIRILPEIRKEIPDATLWLVGEGDERESLEKYSSELLPRGAVTFFGRRGDALAFMKKCSLYMSASRIEGLPFNIAEALSAGATVLASDVKGHRDMLSEGAGFLFDGEDDSSAVALAISLLKGQITVSEESKRDGYLKYSFDKVFPETLRKILVLGNLWEGNE